MAAHDTVTGLVQAFIASPEFALSRAPANWPGAALKGATRAGGSDFLLIGNCHVRPIARCLQALTGDVIPDTMLHDFATLQNIKEGRLDWEKYRHIIVQSPDVDLILSNYPQAADRLVTFPLVYFAGYHPDLVLATSTSQHNWVKGPLIEYNSSLILFGYLNGMDVGETVSLFNEDVYRHLDFSSYWDTASAWLVHESNYKLGSNLTGGASTFRMDTLLEAWVRQGCFMHSTNHPKVSVCADLARGILTALNLPVAHPHPDEFVYDDMADGPAWPVYPEIAATLGLPGDYRFKLPKKLDKSVSFLTLEEFVEASFEVYRTLDPDDIVCERLDTKPYRELGEFLKGRALRPRRSGSPQEATEAAVGPRDAFTPVHPYRSLPDFHFWRRSIENVAVENVDPVVSEGFRIEREQKIATAGSCFAQQISRMMRTNELNYYVAETAPEHLSDFEAVRRNYGVFSARYGNIYTARQLLQLFDRCYGEFRPAERVWRRADGAYVDPFRPEIEPDGFASPDLLGSARRGASI